MVYLILTGLYFYVVLKTGLQYLTKHKPLNFLHNNYRLRFAEVILFTLILGYTFNYFYFKQNEFNDFIVSRTLLWVAFVASTLMLGIGIGMRFASETLQSTLLKGSEQIFKEIKKIHDVFSQIWINLSVSFLFFIYCIMEISKADNSPLKTYEMLIVYLLSIGFGIIYSLQHRDQHPLLRRASLVIFAMLGICLFTFIVESNLSFITDLPISTSYFLFVVLFVGFSVWDLKHEKKNIKIDEKEISPQIEISELDSEDKTIEQSSLQDREEEVNKSIQTVDDQDYQLLNLPSNISKPEEPSAQFLSDEVTIENTQTPTQNLASPEVIAEINEEVQESVSINTESIKKETPPKIFSLKDLKA